VKLHHARKTGLSLLLVLSLAGFGRCAEEPTWKLTWSDEFEGAAGESPSAANWTFDVGTGVGGWGNLQWEYDTARPENASLDGEGHLVITSRKESYGGKDYTSARMKTQGLFARQYGRIEARMKLPVGQGLWPAFWMLGTNIDEPGVGWPKCGEIDIMEYRGQERSQVTGTLHGPGYSADKGISATYDLPAGRSFDEDFHVFAVEWTPDWISWELDGKSWQTVVPAATASRGEWVFDHPFFILLNVAVGGFYVGDPDPAAFPPEGVKTYVDYVRVYSEG
jgi:beta-glucanase (GH16 family)